MQYPPSVPLRRYVVAGLVGAAVVGGILLLVRPFIFTFAAPLGADRLVDCARDTWTWDGIPIDPADPPLIGFPTTVRNGAVVVDFTRPISPPAS